MQTAQAPDLTEEAVLRRALTMADGSAGRAAELLGVSRQTVWRRMKRYGIEVKRVIETTA